MIPYVQVPSIHLWGPFTLQPFGLLVVLGCVVGYAVGHRYCRQIGLDVNSFRRLALWVTVSAFLMSHWASLGLYYPERLPTILAQQPLQLLAIGASMSSYGGLGGGPWRRSYMGNSAGCPCGPMGTPSPLGGWQAGGLGAWDVR
jgi:prolipoprotein diacylglyceryltransferase